MNLDYHARAQDFASRYLSGDGSELEFPKEVNQNLRSLLHRNYFVEWGNVSGMPYFIKTRIDGRVVRGYDLLLRRDLSQNPIVSPPDKPKHHYSLVSLSGSEGECRFNSDLEMVLNSAKKVVSSNNDLSEYRNVAAVAVGGLGAGLAAFLPAYHFILSKGMGADIPHLKDVLVPLGLLVAVVAGVAGGAQYAKHHRKHLNEVYEDAEREFNQNWKKFNEDYLATRTLYDQQALKKALGVE